MGFGFSTVSVVDTYTTLQKHTRTKCFTFHERSLFDNTIIGVSLTTALPLYFTVDIIATEKALQCFFCRKL